MIPYDPYNNRYPERFDFVEGKFEYIKNADDRERALKIIDERFKANEKKFGYSPYYMFDQIIRVQNCIFYNPNEDMLL